MCGISGFIDFSKQSSQTILQRMNSTLLHRGSDGAGDFFYEADTYQIGLAHRRLSIIDLNETGAQPMHFKNGCIIFNGEIYNYQEIKKELEGLGHLFQGNSDTEVIIQAYAQWGIACLQKLIGMFAFVLYDKNKDEVFMVRDRAGVKPFFYYWDKKMFLFASELKAFHQHPHFKKNLNENAVAAFLQYGHVPTPYCIFENTYKLTPGSYLHFKIKTGTFEEISYWNVYDYYNKNKLDISFEEARKKTDTILEKAFQYRMVSDVPVGVFLSGGYDSACVAALLQKNSTQKIKTFTIEVPHKGLNEAPFAKKIAQHIGTEHFEFTCTSKEALDLITDLPYYYDEPFADSSAIPTSLVCKMAHKQVTVALSADGGDEVFAGYNRYDYMMRYGKKLQQIPSSFKSVASSFMRAVSSEKIPILKNKYNFHQRYEKIKNLLQDASYQNIALSLSQQWNEEQVQSFCNFTYTPFKTAYHSENVLPHFFTPLSYMMALDYQTYLLDDILQKVDRASMRFSLEGREPFLDQNIIEWAAQLPDHFKYNKGVKKYILKEIVHQYIPKQLMDRPKMGFAIPIEDWLLYDLKDKVFYYLDKNRINKQGVLNAEAVEKIKQQFYSGKKELALKIWHLLMFEMWYEKWM
ncbi:MAG: asparagine synthase (glutamine-hydrolyzing) [Bacteroidetes bacterium]|nr:asparagine synthase (glutamine-hydrolyzing) [Bacteroidota bacterium]